MWLWQVKGCQQGNPLHRNLRISVHFATNKRQPLFIGESQSPCAFGKKMPKEMGFKYCFNQSAWMTGAIYEEWIWDWDNELAAMMPPCKILLLHNNFSGHTVPDDLQCIQVKKLAPNLTSHIQPLDAGIIANFKKDLLERVPCPSHLLQ